MDIFVKTFYCGMDFLTLKKKKILLLEVCHYHVCLSCVLPCVSFPPSSLNFKPITQILKKQIRSKSSERSGEPIQDKDISSSDKEPYLS